MADSIETTGTDIETAVQAALTQLGLTREAVTVDVLEEPQRRLLGLGGKPARVRVTPLPRPAQAAVNAPPPPAPVASTPAAPSKAPPAESYTFQPDEGLQAQLSAAAPTRRPVKSRKPSNPADYDFDDDSQAVEAVSAEELNREAVVGVEILQTILDRMNLDATVEARRADTDGREAQHWLLDVRGSDLADLIGAKGEMLASLQYLTRLIASHQLSRRANLVIDIEGYKARREDQLKRLAKRMAAQAVERGRMVSMEPMPPNERRVIHLALRDDPTVTTESVGEGERRKVTILPKRTGGR